MVHMQVEDLGIDWDGPVGADDNTTVILEDIQSPLSESQEEVLVALLADLSQPNDFTTEDIWIQQYLAAQAFVHGEL